MLHIVVKRQYVDFRKIHTCVLKILLYSHDKRRAFFQKDVQKSVKRQKNASIYKKDTQKTAEMMLFINYYVRVYEYYVAK